MWEVVTPAQERLCRVVAESSAQERLMLGPDDLFGVRTVGVAGRMLLRGLDHPAVLEADGHPRGPDRWCGRRHRWVLDHTHALHQRTDRRVPHDLVGVCLDAVASQKDSGSNVERNGVLAGESGMRV